MNLLKIKPPRTRDEVLTLGTIESYETYVGSDEVSFLVAVKPDDHRVWEVLLGTGVFYSINEKEWLSMSYYKPPRVTIIVEDDDKLEELTDAIVISGVPWPLTEIVHLEFIKSGELGGLGDE